MKTWSFDSPDPETTHAVAVELGRSIGASGLVLGLIGPLGAGKTVFVKGLAAGLGVEPAQVSSPTFVIAQQYFVPPDVSPRPDVLHHVDLYRLESEEELDGIGFSDLFAPGCVVATEWADRFPGVLGPDRLDIELDGPSMPEATHRARSARVTAHGDVAEIVLEDWVERVERMTRLAPKAGGEGAGPGPQARAAWLLVLALLLAGVSRLPVDISAPLCVNAEERSGDAVGTLRVVCRPDHATGTRPHGIAGLLFGRRLDLAVVTAAQLEALPGIGPSRAEAIVAHRARSAFAELRDLERVPGIGPKTRERLSNWLEVVSEGSESLTPRHAHTETDSDRG